MSQFRTAGNYRPAAVFNIGNSLARTRGIKRTTVDPRDPPGITRREYRHGRRQRFEYLTIATHAELTQLALLGRGEDANA